MGRARVAASVVLFALLFFAIAASAPSVVHAKGCRDIQVAGTTYVVGGAGAPCRFMRSWSKRLIRGSDGPTGWSCNRRSTSGGCDHRASRAFFIYYPPH